MNLDDLPWISATARMSTTDIMWSYSVQVHGDASNISPYEMLEYRLPVSNFPIIRCLPTGKIISYDHPSMVTEITGYSKSLYLRNPIPVCERQSKITLDSNGNVIAYENPLEYITRIWELQDYGLILDFQAIPEPPNTIPDGDTTKYALKKQYTFDAHPISDILSEIASDYDRVYFERIHFDRLNDDIVHKFSMINFSDIDEMLELPPQITIDANDNRLIGSPGLKISRDLIDCKNVVWVELCRKKDNAWFYAERKSCAVESGSELPRYLVYRSSNLLPDPARDSWSTSPYGNAFGPVTTIPGYTDQTGGVNFGTDEENAECQQIADDKADELISLLDLDVKQYELTIRFSDDWYPELALYQRARFSGFDTIPDELMRITDIEYVLSPPGEGESVANLVVVPDAEIQANRQFELMQNEIRSNQIALQQSIERNVVNNKIGVVTSVTPDRTYANLQLRSSGRIVQVRAWGERITS